MKKTGLKVYVYDFSVYYDTIMVSDILNIHRYLMKKKEKCQNVRICEANICFNNDAFGLEFIEHKSIRMCLNEQRKMESKT